jgi:hypothetical protein
MNRPGHDLSWHAIRQRHAHGMEPRHSISSNHKCPTTPLLANSSKSLLANITGTDDQPFISTTVTLPDASTNHIVTRQSSKCRNPHHHHDPNDVLLPRDMRVFRSEMRTIVAELKFLTGYVRKEEAEDDVSQDWKFSAMVIDRLCLILFSMMTTIFSYVTLFSAPNFFKLR